MEEATAPVTTDEYTSASGSSTIDSIGGESMIFGIQVRYRTAAAMRAHGAEK